MRVNFFLGAPPLVVICTWSKSNVAAGVSASQSTKLLVGGRGGNSERARGQGGRWSVVTREDVRERGGGAGRGPPRKAV